MTEMTAQEAAETTVALLTAFSGGDFETATQMTKDITPEQTPQMISALCGAWDGLVRSTAHAVGADPQALALAILQSVGTGMAARNTD